VNHDLPANCTINENAFTGIGMIPVFAPRGGT